MKDRRISIHSWSQYVCRSAIWTRGKRRGFPQPPRATRVGPEFHEFCLFLGDYFWAGLFFPFFLSVFEIGNLLVLKSDFNDCGATLHMYTCDMSYMRDISYMCHVLMSDFRLGGNLGSKPRNTGSQRSECGKQSPISKKKRGKKSGNGMFELKRQHNSTSGRNYVRLQISGRGDVRSQKHQEKSLEKPSLPWHKRKRDKKTRGNLVRLLWRAEAAAGLKLLLAARPRVAFAHMLA